MKLLRNMVMKEEFSNKRDHDFLTHPERFKDLIGSFDRTNNARSSGTWLLTFFSPKDLAILR